MKFNLIEQIKLNLNTLFILVYNNILYLNKLNLTKRIHAGLIL